MPVLEKKLLTLDSAPAVPVATWSAERSVLAAQSLRASGRLRLQVLGESMLPTLWPGDIVEIASCSLEDIRPGEIVLASRDRRFFLHRYVACPRPGGFSLQGDSMPGPDPEFPSDAFLGRLIRCVGRGDDRGQARPVLALQPWSRVIGRLLCHCGPARRIALKLHARRKRAALDPRNTADANSLGAADLQAS